MEWQYDWKTDTWLSNGPGDGCGIYFDETSRKWFVNIVFRNELYLGGTFASFKEAKEQAELYSNELEQDSLPCV